ncbi:hypothetical protein E2320_019185 [Naja naja]|nr:hypothetical protein E2320_019185 [Naja naja]
MFLVPPLPLPPPLVSHPSSPLAPSPPPPLPPPLLSDALASEAAGPGLQRAGSCSRQGELKGINGRLQAENCKLGDLCCFLDEDRLKAKLLARQ